MKNVIFGLLVLAGASSFASEKAYTLSCLTYNIEQNGGGKPTATPIPGSEKSMDFDLNKAGGQVDTQFRVPKTGTTLHVYSMASVVDIGNGSLAANGRMGVAFVINAKSGQYDRGFEIWLSKNDQDQLPSGVADVRDGEALYEVVCKVTPKI